MQALSIEAFKLLAEQGGIIIDIRKSDLIKTGFIKGSLAIQSFQQIQEYIKALTDNSTHSDQTFILLICENSEKESLISKVATAGIPVKGWLSGGYDAWVEAKGATDLIIEVEIDELMMDIPFDDNLIIVDVRPTIQFRNGHLKDAINLTPADLTNPLRLAAIEDNDNLYIVAETDDEGLYAATLLKKQDIHNLRVVSGGWEAVQKEPQIQIVKDPELLN